MHPELENNKIINKQPFNRLTNQLLNQLTNAVFYFAILFFIIGFNFSDRMAGNWYQQFLPNLNGASIRDIIFTDSLNGHCITSIGGSNSYILKTTNSGDNWVIKFMHTQPFVRVQFINANTGFTNSFQTIFKTTNSGENWTSINLPGIFGDDMFVLNDSTIWLAMSESLTGGVFRTTNGGASWQQQLNIGSQNPTNIYFYDKDTGFTAKNTLYKTTNGGLNWNLVPGGTGFSDMHFINSLTGWKCYGPMQKTTNGGLNWINQILPSGGIILDNSMISFNNFGSDTIWGTGGLVFYGAGQFRGIIYRTINGGTTWQFQIPDTAIHSGTYQHIKFVNKRIGWAYWPAGGIHTILGGDPEWITAFEQTSTEVPKEFKLFQNYPNPFNPVTKIKFQLSKQSKTEITIYDITGRKVQKLLNDELNAGVYETDWNAAGLASGIYFCTLTVITGKEVFTDTKKIIFIK